MLTTNNPGLDKQKDVEIDIRGTLDRKCRDDFQVFLPIKCEDIRNMVHSISWIESIEPKSSSGKDRYYRYAKRTMDLVLTLAALPLLTVLFLLTAFLIKLEDPKGPVLFTQDRTGKDGKRFKMFKFRTMVYNAEELKKSLAHLNELEYPDFKIANDPRITRVGYFLRQTSLDELPQFINILRGEMSLVGPRPTSFKADTYELWQTERLDVIPGLTGLWQVLGRSNLEFCHRACLDILYIQRRSIKLDILVLINTFTAVITRRGAY